MTWTAHLRTAIVDSGRSQYELSRATGVSQSLISRLLSGGSINWENGCKLAAEVGFSLKKAGKSRKSLCKSS